MQEIVIRTLREEELPAADRIFRLAFGTFLGLPDPMDFAGDADFVRSRWRADPEAAFGAEVQGELVGAVFATRWGSVGFFGPLVVHPQFWERKVGQRLLAPVMALFDRWGITHAGLFTFAHSPKHAALYQKLGFWPRFLTPLMAKPVSPPADAPAWSGYGELPERERASCLEACRALTGAIYPGLDVEREIRAAAEQGLGETVLLQKGGRLAVLAVCHCGPGTEAGSDTLYVKFGAAHPGPGAGDRFDSLLAACEALAASRGLKQVIAGVNMARHDAYRRMLARGFRTLMQGVAMQRPNEPGYNRPDAYVIDDWR
jgi:predicted N-acetyltransferase YhbS